MLNSGAGLPGRASGGTISLGSYSFGDADLRTTDRESFDPLSLGVFSGAPGAHPTDTHKFHTLAPGSNAEDAGLTPNRPASPM